MSIQKGHARRTHDARADMRAVEEASTPRERATIAGVSALLVMALSAMSIPLVACSSATGTAQTTDVSPDISEAKTSSQQADARAGESSARVSEPQETPEQREHRRQEALKSTIRTYVAPSPYEEDALLYGNEPLLAGTAPAGTACGVSMASDTVGNTVAFSELSRAIADLEGQGYTVGMSLCDLTGEEIFAYNADAPLYPASAIKGPYVLSVWRDIGSPSGSVRRWSENIFGWSDNDSYHAMQDTYGGAPLRRLAEECGLDMSWYGGDEWSWSQWYYPRTSASDMSRMWVACSGYILDMGNEDAGDLREFILEREVSPMRDGLGGTATTYAKAGWISEGGDYGATPAAVDSGIILWPDGRAYVLTVMTNTEEDMDAVAGLVACADRCHFAMINPDSTQNATAETASASTASPTEELQASLPVAVPVAIPDTFGDTVPADSDNGLSALRNMLP